jgi:large subunit ribosomal protein L10
MSYPGPGFIREEKDVMYLILYALHFFPIAISESDPVVAAKILKTYAEKVESFEILAGYVDGAVIDAKTVNELAEIPNKETLIAKLLGSIQSPLYKFAYAIKAITDKENGGEEAPAEA